MPELCSVAANGLNLSRVSDKKRQKQTEKRQKQTENSRQSANRNYKTAHLRQSKPKKKSPIQNQNPNPKPKLKPKPKLPKPIPRIPFKVLLRQLQQSRQGAIDGLTVARANMPQETAEQLLRRQFNAEMRIHIERER
jgi:hypothetical protein